MKYFVIFLVLAGFVVSPYFISDSFGLCMPNQDWPDAPCYGRPGAYPGLEQEKLDWTPYYDYKGSVWMDAKKQQMDSAIHNNSLREWFKQDDAHKNAHKYYFLHGDVPNIYGMTFEEMLGFEQAWDAVENNSPDAPLLLWNYHDVILDGEIVETDLAVLLTGDDVPLHHLKVNKYFKGDRNSEMISAIDNFSDLKFELFENGLFYLKKLDNQNLYTVTVASLPTFGTCDARDLIEISPVLPNEKPPISAPAHPNGIDPCVPNYFDVDPDGIRLPNSSLDIAEFVGLEDTYRLGEKFTIKFEKMTTQPCPSYEISLIKDGYPESKITRGVEPLCATTVPVEPYLFSDEFSKPEFFDTAGTYHVELKIDGTTLLKKIEIIDQTFSIMQKQVRYVIPYEITGGSIDDMNLDCSSASLVLWVSSDDSGTAQLDIPNSMLEGIFMVLVNDKEHEDVSLDGNKLTINFPKDTDNIEIKGTYSLNDDITGVCDVVHDPPYSYVLSPLEQFKSGVSSDEIQCKENMVLLQKHNGSPACVTESTKQKLIARGWTDRQENNSLHDTKYADLPIVDSLRPDDRLQVGNIAGYTTVYVTLSSWDEYNHWESKRGEEHDKMPPLVITQENINPIVFDLLQEMWKFEDYQVSNYDSHLFKKKIQKDYSVPNHHGIQDWMKSEYTKQFGPSNDGFSHYFEFQDNVYTITILAAD